MLDSFDLADSEIYGLPAEIVYPDDEDGAPVSLKLSRGRPNQDQRAFLARDKGRLPVPHQCLLLWI